MNSRTYAQTKKAPAFSVLPARKPAPHRRSLLRDVGEGHGGFNFGNIPLFSGNEIPVQTKLTIGKPGDRYEQEADSMADRVMSMPDPNVQRKCAECKEAENLQRQPEEEEDKELLQSKELQRQPEEKEEEEISPMSNELRRETDEEEEEETVKMKSLSGGTPQVTPELQNSINSMKGGGTPLPASTRAFFEPRFNRDFSGVRLHMDSRAAETAKSINARAFTVGRNIAFGTGQYSPETSSGKRLLAHELTHTLQQISSPLIGRQISESNTEEKTKGAKKKPKSEKAVIKTEELAPDIISELALATYDWSKLNFNVEKLIGSSQKDKAGLITEALDSTRENVITFRKENDDKIPSKKKTAEFFLNNLKSKLGGEVGKHVWKAVSKRFGPMRPEGIELKGGWPDIVEIGVTTLIVIEVGKKYPDLDFGPFKRKGGNIYQIDIPTIGGSLKVRFSRAKVLEIKYDIKASIYVPPSKDPSLGLNVGLEFDFYFSDIKLDANLKIINLNLNYKDKKPGKETEVQISVTKYLNFSR